jgi:effector-binding domain-containing protein
MDGGFTVTIISGPKIEERTEQPYMGIRTRTPMQGMSKVVTQLFKEINAWTQKHNIKPAKAPFLRFYVIDMEGEMDIEVGVPVETPLQEDGWVTAGVLPAGRYASLIYSGSGLAGNKTLVEWAKANKIAWDRWEDEKGDAFRARFESYLTDPRSEPRKTKWEVEVAIKLADDQISDIQSRSAPAQNSGC